MKRMFLVAAIVVGAALAVTAQHASDSRFERALDAWDAGDYVTALTGFRAVLTGPDGDRYVERLALITGELFEVTELAPDGRLIRFSPNGRHVAFDTGSRANPRVHVVAVRSTPPASWDIEGSNLAFSPAGDKAAFLRVKATPDIAKLRADIERIASQPEPDRQALVQAQRALTQLEAASAELIVRDLGSGQEKVVPPLEPTSWTE
jgi:hypothetical protein